MPTNNKKKITTFGFDEDALATFTHGGAIRNSGRLETHGDLANGIFALADAVTIRNLGEIESTGRGAQAILAIGSGNSVSNHGTIRTTGNEFDPNGIPFDGDEQISDAIDVFGNGNTVNNYGDIRAEGFSASAIAAFGDNNLITNHGSASSAGNFSGVLAAIGGGNSITNRGLVVAEGRQDPGLVIVGFGNQALNTGTIRVLGGRYSEGMRAYGEGNSLINRGAISVAGDDYASGMLLIGGANQAATNCGSILISNYYGFGMGAAGYDLGVNLALRNVGSIVTAGDHGVGMLSGAPRFDDIPDPPHDGRLWDQTFDGLIENKGSIHTTGNGGAGIVMYAVRGEIRNSGRIETWGGVSQDGPMGPLASSGIVAVGTDILIKNSRTGVVVVHDQDAPALQLNVVQGVTTNAAQHSTLINWGTISAPELAVVGGDALETVRNYGRITGDVDLGGGADTYVAEKGGALAGVLCLGSGDDIVILKDGSGRTVIGDFEAGRGSDDVLDLSAFGFSSLSGVQAAARQVGNDLVINLDRNDQLVLQNVDAGQLHTTDFLFLI